jgi:osomolarity two-component system sensor histidine kinase SLN1
MRSLFIPVRLVAVARGLEFEYHLDKNIDQVCFIQSPLSSSTQKCLVKVARRATYEAMGESIHDITRHMEETPDVEGIVVGDETRLRQVVTNLAR